MTSYLKSYFAGKAASFFVNAEADAKDAQVICQFLKLKPISSIVSPRTSTMLKQWQSNPTTLILAAYSLYFHNGFADHIYARLIARAAGFTLPASKYYQYNHFTITDLFLPWLEICFRWPKYLEIFCKDNKLTLPITTQKDILNVTQKMQKINIAVNKQTIASLRFNQPTSKVILLKKLSQTVSNTSIFLKSAQQTQKSAIFWDTLFIYLIQFRLLLNFKSGK